jgi:hypothetical protein
MIFLVDSIFIYFSILRHIAPRVVYLSWKNSKLIANAAPNIDHVPSANAKLRRSMNELSDYIDEITESGAIHNMTATDIKKNFNHKAQTETYNFNSYYEHFAN